jgi:AraC family transcriptional regulator of adaptative response/methylated-DNA-[protein]-cysteine methyltransferase
MPLPADDDTLYAALIARDPAYDGFYFVGVTTTGVYCRLTCPARKPKRTNVRFFSHRADAECAGFRACLRCRPDRRGPAASGVPAAVRQLIDAAPERRWKAAELRALGHDPSSVRRAFQQAYGVTFAQFARTRRLGAAMERLRDGGSVIEAQLDAAYESGSGFREAIVKLLGHVPSRAARVSALSAAWIETPIGSMLAVAGEDGLYLLEFADRAALPSELTRLQQLRGPVCFGRSPLLDDLTTQVTRYFSDPCAGFDIPLALRGSAFENQVWAALRAVPPGETRSYGELARSLDRPEAARAIARANGANQVAIIVPCHRILGADGCLRGYGGKLWRKRWLLEHEHRNHLPRKNDHGKG